jgi:hypothetical protein
LCGKIKEIIEFCKHRNRIGGVSDECKQCVSKRNQKRYASNRFGPERMRAFKQHAKKLNVPFNLKANDLERLWQMQQGLCFYSKIPMTFENSCYNTVSADRVDSTKGYTIDNMVLCCTFVNRMKSEGSYELLYEICKKIVENPLDVTKTPDLLRGKKFYLKYLQRNSDKNT